MAQAIRRFRASLGDTQKEFAKRTGLTLTSIARYETNSQPSKGVLAKFAEIAQQTNLPLFIEIFEGRLEPHSLDFEDQELSASIRHLKQVVDELEFHRYGHRKAKLLLIVDLIPPAKYSEAERALEKFVSTTTLEEALNRISGDYVRGLDPVKEKNRVQIREASTPKLLIEALIAIIQRESDRTGHPMLSDEEVDELRKEAFAYQQERRLEEKVELRHHKLGNVKKITASVKSPTAD